MSRRLELARLKFGKLFIVDVAYRKGKHLYWNALCDCGNKTIQCTTNLRSGNVYSCGCERSRLSAERVALLPKVKFETGKASFNVLFYQYKFSAKRRNISFRLTKEEFKKLTEQNCFYCGVMPKYKISRSRVNGEFIYNGIDRVDNAKGYELVNCVSCCGICNKMKLDFSLPFFIDHIRKILEHIK